MYTRLSYKEGLAKSGAVVSSAGVALFVAFVAVLLAFPVLKECESDDRCTYLSAAPEPLSSIVKPDFLAVSLVTISAGVVIVRFSRWRSYKKSAGNI